MIKLEICMKNILLKYVAFLPVLFFIAACSELKDDIPSVPKISTHNEGIFDSASSSFHPLTIADSPNGMYDCTQCHAANFSGGTAGVGCSKTGCHPGIEVHVAGFLDPNDVNFHGNYIKNHGWDMIRCQPCHGENYAGDELSPSCLNCHTYLNGPENCSTCHGSVSSNAPPKDINGDTSTTARGVGSHQAHLQGNVLGRNLTCTECHNVPGSVYTPGHVDSDLPAEVLMNNPRANTVTNEPNTTQYDPQLPLFEPNPVYNSADLTCANTYCHGYFKNGNKNNSPVWTDPSTSECGSCHGDALSPMPLTESEGGSHPDNENCSVCHGGVVNVDLKIINPLKHIDGKLNLFGNDIDF